MKNNLKMLLEELLPFYFLLMVLVILFTGYVPTTIELYIVYAFSFGVVMFNNRLHQQNVDLLSYKEKSESWQEEALDMVDIIEKENVALRKKVAEMSYEMEMVKLEGDSISVCDNCIDNIHQESEEFVRESEEDK